MALEEESDMYARIVTARPKPNMVEEATRTLETQILPLLNARKGFREAYWVTPGDDEAVAISFWDSQEDAEAYAQEDGPRVMSLMANLTEGTPQIKGYDVIFSTAKKASASGA
jgi:heme-degrading monooxygenase HmoA